jgi:hypothetical protein
VPGVPKVLRVLRVLLYALRFTLYALRCFLITQSRKEKVKFCVIQKSEIENPNRAEGELGRAKSEILET